MRIGNWPLIIVSLLWLPCAAWGFTDAEYAEHLDKLKAKVPPDLAARCQQVLDDRVRALAHTRNDALPNWILYLGPGFAERAPTSSAFSARRASPSEIFAR